MSHSNHKYQLLRNDTIETEGITLYRIQALRNFGNVIEGDLGGYIQSYSNLAQCDNCWIWSFAKVYNKAKVQDNAMIYNNAIVKGKAVIYDNARICDNAIVMDDVIVSGNAIIHNYAKIYGKATISGNAYIMNNVVIMHNANVKDNATVMNNVVIGSNARIMSNTCLCGDLVIENTNDVLVLGPIGPKDDIFTFVNTKDSIQVIYNGLSSSIDVFEQNIINKYQSSIYNDNYKDTIDYVRHYFQKTNIIEEPTTKKLDTLKINITESRAKDFKVCSKNVKRNPAISEAFSSKNRNKHIITE